MVEQPEYFATRPAPSAAEGPLRFAARGCRIRTESPILLAFSITYPTSISANAQKLPRAEAGGGEPGRLAGWVPVLTRPS